MGTNLNIFFTNFDLLLEAPNSIQKLREMILQLAVQGKLVPQDPKDEPALELLKKIKSEKGKLIAEGKIKKEKPLTPIKPEEILYELPKGWEWIKLGEILSFEYGEGLTKDHRSESGKYPVFGSNGIVGYHDSYITEKPAIIIGRKGSSGALNLTYKPSWTTDVAYYCVPPEYMDIEYTFIALKTTRLDELGKGIKPGLNRMEAYIKLFPVPPFEEQKRIVAKVDELMKLCDELEIKKKKAEKARVVLNDASLDRLMSAENSEEFLKRWSFVSNNFDTFYDVPGNVNKLRQVILQLAVQGELVPQEPNNEPASELLKRIKAEKEKLIAEGKIKKEKLLSPIKPEEIPYELPSGWEWVRLPEIVRCDSHAIKRGPFGSAIKKEFFVPSGYKVYEQRNAIYDDFKLGNYYINEDKFEELRAFEVKPFDIIVSCSGTIGKVAIAPEGMARGIINQALLKITLNQDIMINEFFKIIFTSFIMQTKELSDLRGTAMKNITSINVLKELPLPLPPLQEQIRILKKIELLMNQCDGLESQLRKSQKDSEILMKAVL